jgi:hypothetical protein
MFAPALRTAKLTLLSLRLLPWQFSRAADETM